MEKQVKFRFTLVELLVSIGIVLLLAAITLGGISFASHRADESQTKAIISQLDSALEAFKNDYKYYPLQKTEGDIVFSDSTWDLFLNRTTNKRNRPYMEGIDKNNDTTLNDAYGNPLKYVYPATRGNSTRFNLWSLGKDETDNTEDDICNWKE